MIKKEAVRNILAVRNDRFGEFLLNIPAFRALKETFGQAKIIAVVDPNVENLAKCVPYLDEIITWGNQGQSLFAKFNLLQKLSKRRIDLAIVLNPTKEFHYLTFLARIPERVGYNRKWGFLLTRKITDSKYLADKHEVEYNLELVGLVGAKTEDKGLVLDISEGMLVRARQLLKTKENLPLVILHPWASDARKLWPRENFLELANKLLKELKVNVAFVGGKENSLSTHDFFKIKDSNFIDFTGKTSLEELAALLKISKLLVSADSGPVHLACAVGTPVIALFRNDLQGKTAKRWGPWGNCCRVIEKSNLAKISVEEVFARVKEVIEA